MTAEYESVHQQSKGYGYSTGIGIEAARIIFQPGATFRDLEEKAKPALGDIQENDLVHLLELDLASLLSVRNILIANAGVMATLEGRTIDGLETQFGTNHLAHFLLNQFLLPTGEYHTWLACAQSKTASLYTAVELERLYGHRGLYAWAVNPGIVSTSLTKHLKDKEVLEQWGQGVEVGNAINTTAKAMEGQGGLYPEHCQMSKPTKPNPKGHEPGYVAHTYDKSNARVLLGKSLELFE
ncbi:hypothetical protein BKA66DRAFT_517230 [Pyrenochaeta sp. MPI-SDFR-AT-0127]|nr:hypothetical protein BKA66DRAFT_517230 [Pyrenochaeta sp. MPI-SDFR-AT-0127]